MSDSGQLLAQAELFRATGLLGRPGSLSRLFDYLISRSAAGAAPKEVEIAIEVFGRTDVSALAQDSIVRVYVHKLRRKLDEFHAQAGSSQAVRLTLMKGEYRFILSPREPEVSPAFQPDKARAVDTTLGRVRRWPSITAAVALLLVVVLSTAAALRPGDSDLERVRNSSIWSALLDDNLPIVVVLGDYYIFGEVDPHTGAVKRMVREFTINSPRELEEQLQSDPNNASRYEDLDLAYLPTSTAFAMRDVLTTLAAPGQPAQRVKVVLASDLTTAMLKSSHIVYIGYLSGMRQLQELAFSGSRLSIGGSFDELIDNSTGQRYVSQAGGPREAGAMFRDYAYFSSFAGPANNRFLIISGTRDVALMQMAEALTQPARLAELNRSSRPGVAFEALYEVAGLDRFNLSGKLLFSSALDDGHWRGDRVAMTQ
jgi:hypothetical protein